jgi:adenine/guanine phosphoribosyltransferase-like PRPP-binding protein
VPFAPDFPDVVIQRPYGSPVRYVDHPDYAAAKAGDPEAADRFVDDMIDPAKVDALRHAIGDSKPTVVAAHAEEAAGRNAIPQTYAKVLARDFGLPVDEDIVQANGPQRTGQGGEYRLSVHSEFDGPVPPGHHYLIVDDNVTQGGTLADLRSYIETRGGRVIAATTLTGSRQSEILAPRAETLAALREKFPDLESKWKGAFGHDFGGLTQSEASYLLRSPPADALGDRIVARAQEGTQSQIRRNPRPQGRGEEGYGGDGDPGGGDQGGGGVAPPPGGPDTGADGGDHTRSAGAGGDPTGCDGAGGEPAGRDGAGGDPA